jgi:dTDP-4-dehydrorhamnose 3,5-epimerase-like enzyme
MESRIRIIELPDRGDARGYSFTTPAEALEFVGAIQDVHFASVLPGAVRGNHFHLRRREAIVIFGQSTWSFHWDEGESTPPRHKEITRPGATLITVAPGASHAVRNDGSQVLTLAAFSSETYDPAETVARKLI